MVRSILKVLVSALQTFSRAFPASAWAWSAAPAALVTLTQGMLPAPSLICILRMPRALLYTTQAMAPWAWAMDCFSGKELLPRDTTATLPLTSRPS